MNKHFCEKCNYKSKTKQNFEKHLISKKHLNNDENSEYTCNHCNKKYKSYSGLWRHNKNCKSEENDKIENIVIETAMPIVETSNDLSEKINKIMENQENLKKIIIELSKKNTSVTNNIQTNIFLNEKCANAINMSDFIKSINMNAENLEKIGEFGYIDYIAEYLKEKIESLSIFARPIHYEIKNKEDSGIHIRENNKWTIESIESPMIYDLMLEIDTKIFDNYKEYLKNTNQKNNKLIEKQLSRGSRENNRKEVLKMVLEDVEINENVILDSICEI